MNSQVNHYQTKLAYEIDSADVAAYFINPDEREEMIVIDTRTPESFKVEHIPGAINFPHRKMTAESVKALRKDALYITYCDGIGCNASTKGALKLSTFGFKVREMMGGLGWWKRDGYTTEGDLGAKRELHVMCAC
jgi:rhodanese-related sulfurtransferase